MNLKTIITEVFVFGILITLFIQTIMAQTLLEVFLRSIFFIVIAVFSFFLIRSITKEIEDKEEFAELAGELETANIRLKKLDEAKSEFVTIASHQLRAPLTAIKGYSSMLMENSFGKLGAKMKQPVERIFQSSDKLIILLGEFLDLSRIERGKMDYLMREVDLKAMFNELADEFKIINEREKKDPSNKRASLALVFHVDEKDNFIINADSEKIKHVLYNLIDNAMKYTPKGFIRASLHKDEIGKMAIIKVRDSGIGMSKETLARIFQKFSRAKPNTFQLHTEGLGLGLFVAKEILNAHKGKIWAESEGESKGSTFYVKLPLEKK